MDESRFSGVAFVEQGDGTTRQHTAGWADRDRQLPWRPDVRTQVGSISKQFVAAVALVLEAAGDVDLDRSLTDAWPDLPAHWRDVSLRQLLSHTAGVPHWHDADGYRIEEPLDVTDRLDRLVAADLFTEPGTAWSYSSPGYLIAAAVIERMAGTPYGDLVDPLVLRPLGLTGTRSGLPLEPGAARGYDGEVPAPLLDLHMMPGTGDITSTAADIAAFLRAVNDGDFVDTSPASAYAMVVQLSPDEATASGPVRTDRYALGHFVGTLSGRSAIVCPGDNPGFKALGVWLPDRHDCLVVLGNQEQVGLDATAADMAAQIDVGQAGGA